MWRRFLCRVFGPKLFNEVYSTTCLRCNTPAYICGACHETNHVGTDCRYCGFPADLTEQTK